MSSMSRRDLLLGAFIKKPVEVAKKVIVGRLKDFQVGEQKVFEREQVIIESLPEGLRAKSTTKGELYFGIEMNTRGEVVVDFSRTCSNDVVFSVMTNETIRLNKEINV